MREHKQTQHSTKGHTEVSKLQLNVSPGNENGPLPSEAFPFLIAERCSSTRYPSYVFALAAKHCKTEPILRLLRPITIPPWRLLLGLISTMPSAVAEATAFPQVPSQLTSEFVSVWTRGRFPIISAPLVLTLVDIDGKARLGIEREIVIMQDYHIWLCGDTPEIMFKDQESPRSR
jgi:hypothetical protein